MARRKVTVELELEAARANRSAAELAVTLRGTKAQIEDVGDEADDTSRDLQQMAANTDVAAKRVDNLGDQARTSAAELALLDNRIKATEASVLRLGRAFAGGDDSVGKQLHDERSMLGQLRRIRKEVEGGLKPPRSTSSSWFGGFDFSNFVAEARGVGIGALVALGVLLAPAIGAMVSGAVVGTIAGGGIIGGIVAAAHDPRVEQAWQAFTPILNAKTFGSEAFAPGVIEGIAKLKSLVQDLDVGDTLAQGTGALDELINGLDLFVRNAWPGFARVMGSSDSILRQVEIGLAGTGSALTDFINSILDSKGTLEGLKALFMVINGTIRGTGAFLGFLGDRFHEFNAINAWLSGNTEDVLGWVPWLGTRIREANDNLENLVGTGQVVPNVASAVSGSIAAIVPPAESLADAMRRVNNEFNETNRHILQMVDDQLAYKKSLDDLAQSVIENGTSLDINTEAGAKNIKMLKDGVEIALQTRQNAIDRGVYTQQANEQYQEQIELLVQQAIKYGLNEEAVRHFIQALKDIPPTTKAQLILEMEARGIVPGEHSGPRIGDNPDFGGPGAPRTSSDEGTGRRQPETNEDPLAAILAARAEGKKAAGGSILAGRLYQVNEQRLEYFRSNYDGMVMPLSGASRGWDGAAGGGIDYDRLAAALANLTVRGVATLDGRAVGEFTAGYQTDLALKRPRL